MKYPFECEQHGEFIIEAPMADGPQSSECPVCGQTGRRIFTATQPIYYCDGFHSTDYARFGHKQDLLAKAYEAETGEPAPPPAADAPRNYKVKG